MKSLRPIVFWTLYGIIFIGGLILWARNAGAQSCAPAIKPTTDSIRGLATTTTTHFSATRKAAFRRLATRADSIAATCSPVPRQTLRLTATDTVLRVRPTVPYYVWITARADSAGLVTDSAAFSSSDTSLARIWWNKAATARRLEVYDAKRSGTLVITGRFGSATAFARIRVEVAIPPPPDTTPVPPPDTTPPPPPAQGVALPRSSPVVPAGLDSRPCTLTLASGLQAALNAARGGAVLCLTGRHVGAFTVPARSDTGWIVVRSAGPLPVGRVRPTQSAGLAKIVASGAAPALTLKARSGRIAFIGLEVTSDSALAAGPVNLLQIGDFTEATRADLSTDILLDRLWLHGWAHQDLRRAIAANGGAVTLTRSWCEEIHWRGADSQCFIAWNGSGPFLVEDNALSAGSENVMFGGGDPTVPGLTAEDVTVRRNHIFKPASWMGKGWLVKNLVETKASRRVLIEQNVLEGQWFDGASGHAALVIKSVSQGGTCPKCDTSDWTVRRNLWQHVGNWLSLAGRADQHLGGGAGGPTDSTVRRVAIVENWIDSVAVAPYTNENRPNLIILAENRDVWITGNTIAGAGPTLESALLFDVSGANALPPAINLTMAGNVLPKGRYGMFASATPEGTPSWLRGALGVSTWGTNAMLGASTATYPTGTSWHSSVTSALTVAGVSRATVDAGVVGVVVPR